MGFLEVFLTGVGLSMDALAVSICKGLSQKKIRLKNTVIIALFFGVFQALMPLTGWLLGVNFQKYIEAYDHWIAFVLLAFIGIKMIIDACKNEDENSSESDSDTIDIKELTVLAIATSIDALAVGIAFACLGSSINILPSVLLIGITTFILCFCGIYIGHRFGNRFEKNATFAGGAILILIGLKILLEHLGILDRIFTSVSNFF